MPFVSGFTLRFFEFSIAVVVADRSRVGETDVYVGIARARTCERSLWSMVVHVYWRQFPRFIFSFHLYKLFSGLRLERLELDVSFSGHCARRKKRQKPKRPDKLSRRGSQQMVSHPLDHWNGSKAWEVILVITLSLCSFSICSCIFFPSSSSFIIGLGKSRFFLLVLREIDYRLRIRVAKKW